VPNQNHNGAKQWLLTKEKILMFAGLIIIFAEAVSTEVFARPFHFEFLLAGLALCGISITQWGDKK
jgi:hypothetical protein